MADEEQIGVARLDLEGEYKKFEEGLKQVQTALEKGETSFTKFTEKGAKEGERLLRLQQKVDDEIVRLTGTTTQKQLLEVDKRYRGFVESARKQGLEAEKVAQLEMAIATRKSQVLIAEERRAAEAIESAKSRTSAAIDKVELKTADLRNALRLGGVEAGRFGGALSLLEGAMSPLALGFGIGAAAIFMYTDKLRAAEAATRAMLNSVRDLRVQMKQTALAAGGGDDAEFLGAREAYEKQLAAVNELQIQRNEMAGGARFAIGEHFEKYKGNVPILTDLSEVIAGALKGPTQEKEDELTAELTKLDRLRQAMEIAGEKLTRTQAEFSAQQQAAEEKRAKDHEAANQRVRQADDRAEAEQAKAADAATKTEAARAADRLELAARYDRALVDARIDVLQRLADLDALDGEGRERLLVLQEQRELRRLDEHYLALLEQRRAHGDSTLALEEEIERQRLEIVRKYAKLRAELSPPPAPPPTTSPLGTAGAMPSSSGTPSTPEARRIARDLYYSGNTQAEIAKKLRDQGIDPASVGIGTSWFAGPPPVLNDGKGWGAATGIWPGGVPTFQQVKAAAAAPAPVLELHVINEAPDLVAVQAAENARGEIVIARVARDVLNQGDVWKAFQDAQGRSL